MHNNTLNQLSYLTSCSTTKLIYTSLILLLLFSTEPDLARLLSFQVPNILFFYLALAIPKNSIQIQCPNIYREGFSQLTNTQAVWQSHVGNCLLNAFTAIFWNLELYPTSTTWEHTMLWWQRTHLPWTTTSTMTMIYSDSESALQIPKKWLYRLSLLSEYWQ